MELDTPDGRKKYLSEKLDNLMEGINDSYGKMLLEELIGRLETTIKDFNDEIVELCSQLSEKEKVIVRSTDDVVILMTLLRTIEHDLQ